MRYSDPRLVDQLAASYVLGTLSGAARRRFERLQRDRSDVALAVAGWESRLGRLAEAVSPVVPSSRVWEAVARRTRPAAAVNSNASASGAKPGSRWWLPTGFGLAGFAGGLVAAFALLAVAPGVLFTTDQVAMRNNEKLPQSYVGLLTDAQGNGKLLVSSLRHGRAMTVKAIGPIEARPTGRHLVVWAVPANAPPFVLGTAPTTGSVVAALPDTSERLLSKVSKLVVTEETTATPQSPGTIVFTGNCAKLW
jgi:anti-sigma-K factor RskA